MRWLILFILLSFNVTGQVHAAKIRVAVASNFIEPARKLAKVFKQKHNETVQFSFGSSGKLATQIMQGAPFDVFMSADKALPQKLLAGGYGGLSETRTYAIGQLVLVSHKPNVDFEHIRSGKQIKIALANPRLAPYGRAALEFLRLEQMNSAQSAHQFIVAENIGQVFHFFASGAADYAVVAWSQVKSKPGLVAYHALIPDSEHQPIEQEMMILNSSKNLAIAKKWQDFVVSEQGQEIISNYGYSKPKLMSKAIID